MAEQKKQIVAPTETQTLTGNPRRATITVPWPQPEASLSDIFDV